MKDFNQDFKFFTDLIKSNKNFAYARYADGEVALMRGKEINQSSQAYTVDNWSSPEQLTNTGRQLLESLTHTEDSYYYAISSNTDWSIDHEFLMSRIRIPNNITFANLWIIANYQEMKAFYQNFKKEVYVICNQKAKKESFPFKVVELFPFPDNCVMYWEQHGEDYMSQLVEYVTQLQDKTFFISCGPVSEIIIDKLYKANPNNQYIDVGSSMDEFVHGYKTRPYMDSTTKYAKEVSHFNKPLELPVDQLRVLIPACDKYTHLVEGLMYTTNKFWACKNRFTILGYSQPKFKLLPNWDFISLGVDTGPQNWSNDLLKFFKTFKDEYFINMIDDGIMTRKADMDKIQAAYAYMLENKQVKKCFLHGSLSSGDKSLLGDIELTPTEGLPGFWDVNQTADYRTSIQPAIWSTEYFLQSLKPNLNPWEFETQHTKNDGARILTTKDNHPTMYGGLYRIGGVLVPNWYESVFEDTKLPQEDITYLAELLKLY